MTSDNEIRSLFSKHGVTLSRDDVWTVQSSYVVKHKALERLAAALNIQFDQPQVLRAERDEAVILVSAKLGDVREWSIGEALVNANYRVSGKMAPYVYAMAEKRAKDRVIIKLAGLHGVYSEDEADEFKPPSQTATPKPPKPPAPQITVQSSTDMRDKLIKEINACQSPGELNEWTQKNNRTPRYMFPADLQIVRDALDTRYEQFKELTV